MQAAIQNSDHKMIGFTVPVTTQGKSVAKTKVQKHYN